MQASMRVQTQARLQARPQRAVSVIVRASDGHSTGKFQEGQKVKVTSPVKVFHAPKAPKEGVQLQGHEGVVVKDVTHFKGKVLSANFPYKVEFVLDINGAKSKFQTHLVSC